MKLPAFLLLLASAIAVSAADKPGSPPNILLIMIDDLRPQLGCFGEPQMISPNIDRLAAEGTLFERAYVQVPVCGASRASMMTGLRPEPERFINYDAWASKDAPGIPDWPSWFKAHGYETYSMGKIYHHAEDNRDSWTQLGDPLITKGQNNDYVLEESRRLKDADNMYPSWGGGLSYEAADVPDDEYFQGQLTNAAIARLRAIKASGKSSLLAVGFTKPHLPFVAPKKYWDLYDRSKLVPAPNMFRPVDAPDESMHEFNELRHYRDIPKQGPLSPELALTLQHGYYASVSFTDALVGRVLAELDRLGMRDNTIVLLMGDHGWQLGGHGLWCKHSLFETSLHTPLLVRAPGYPAGGRATGMVEFIDIYPTLCELAGVPAPGHLDGKSFTPLLRDGDQPWKEAVFSRYVRGDSVKTDAARYTEWTDQTGRKMASMLYDHIADPSENVNIVGTPDGANLADRLRPLLPQWDNSKSAPAR